MRTFGTTGRVSCPEDTQTGAPYHLPEVFLGITLPCIPWKPLQPHRVQQGWKSREPLEREPPGKTSKCFIDKSGPLHRTCSRSRTLVGGAFHYQKAGASIHKGECKPLDHLPVPSKRTEAQDGSWFCGSLGKCVFSSSSLRACSRRWDSPLETGCRRVRALGALSLPPSKSSSPEQKQSVPPSPAPRPRRPPRP